MAVRMAPVALRSLGHTRSGRGEFVVSQSVLGKGFAAALLERRRVVAVSSE